MLEDHLTLTLQVEYARRAEADARIVFSLPERAAQDAYVALSVSPSAAALAAAPPPLPFRYIGRLRANGRTELLLMRGTAVYSVAPGAHIDREYRVERITDSTVTFTYLPLKAKQDMSL